MSGTINSLGLGSGVLTANIIDKLKAADVANIISPVDRKITLQKQKDTALGLLNSLLSTFKTSVSSLDNDVLYQNRSVSGTNSSVSVTASAGVAVQSFTISDVVLAKKHVIESGSFSTSGSTVATGSGTMTLNIDSHSYGVDYTASTSLEDLKTAINNKAGGKIQASILQVGTNDYRLITTSKETGVAQSISMSDTGNLSEKAYKLNDTVSSAAFSSADSLVATGVGAAGTYNITMNGVTYPIAYDETTTLTQLKDRINSTVGSNAASIKVEGTSFKLLLQSPTAGEDSTFAVSDTGGYLSTNLTTKVQHGSVTAQNVQQARDATFKYNGITMSRTTNDIEDTVVNGIAKKNSIISGVSIKLLNEIAGANIAITQDVSAISTEMTTMVQSYNTLMSQLNDMTTSNPQTGAVGIFNGDNSIKSISREINRLITSTNSSGLSLPNFGIDLNQNGTMSFNSATFLSKFNSDPSASEAFLSGKTTIDNNGNPKTVDGLFTTINTLMEQYTGTNGRISTLTTGSANELKSLSSNKTRSQALLDARYASMSARFAQYDSMISKLNSQFSSLQQQISMATKSNN